MRKILLLCAIVCACTLPSFAQADEAKLVTEAFANYKTAILNDKGEEAVQFVDSRTIKYYTDILSLVKTADSAKVESLSILDKLMVFVIRHKAPKADILKFNGTSLLVFAINDGMVGKSGVQNNSIGEVTVDKGFAKAPFLANGKTTDFYFHFYKEAKSWKIDLTALFPASITIFKNIATESGLAENDFLFSLLENMTGKKPDPSIWKPLI